VAFPMDSDGSNTYQRQFDLYDHIDAEKSSWRVTKLRIEIIMAKVVEGTWASLEKCIETAKTQSAHDYPTSSRIKHNWDQLNKDVKDDDENQSVDDFFKKLYSSADDDTRRAMQKSFVSLST